MSTFASCLTRRLSRRTLGMGMLGVVGLRAVSGPATTSARSQVVPTPTSFGRCDVEPGIQLLIDWRQGKLVMPMIEMIPPVTWPIYTHPTLGLTFRIPPDWTAVSAWAETITADGVPVWLDRPPMIAQLSLARIISTDNDAAFEFGVGNIQGQPLTPAQVALVAKQGLLGEDPELDPICGYEDAYNPIAPSWFHAEYHDESVLACSGIAIPQPSFIMPATTVTYDNIYGPREDFEELMRTVFIPILFQFLGGGGDDDDDGGDGGDGGNGGDGGDGGDGDDD